MNNVVVKTFIFLLFIFSCSAYARQVGFFSASIRTEMGKNLDGFLRGVPINDGQKYFVERVLKYSEHDKLVLFVNLDFSEGSIEEIAQLQEPFLLIEALDIISVNLGKERIFSNYFFDELFKLSLEAPDPYMIYFFQFCKKSDGFYSEGFYEKLIYVLRHDPNAFLANLGKANVTHEICELLKLGNRGYSINAIRNINADPAITNVADRLLECLESK